MSGPVLPAAPVAAQRPALPDHLRRPTPAPLVTGPRIARLLADLADLVDPADLVDQVDSTSGSADGRQRLLAQFWAEVEAAGTPLVEPDEEPGHRIVTFLLRDRRAADVLLLGNRITDLNELDTARLQHITGTDVWWLGMRLRADWRGTYQLAPMPVRIDPPRPWSGPDRSSWRQFHAAGRPDPLNPLTAPNKFAGPDALLSLVELPQAPAQPWFTARTGAVAGPITEHVVRSPALGGDRRVWLHRPPGPDAPTGLLVLTDGEVWSAPGTSIGPTLDALTATGRIPALLTVMVDSAGPARRSVELACSDDFVRFLADDLLPWTAEQGAPQHDPARTVLAGQSLGGLTALYAAARAPHLFGNVLSQSGSFWWPGGDPTGATAQWLTRTLARVPRLPVAVDLEVGLLEWQLLEQTRHLRSVLTAKGYPLTYREFYGGHDHACWRGGIAEGLMNLTARWSPATALNPGRTDQEVR